jgi:type II secretory pathway pseudopilin PulG
METPMPNHPSTRPPLRRSAPSSRRRSLSAFTLLELLTVIIIIAILVGILLPVISKVRQSAYAADTKNELASIQNAIERYYQVFQAYPGPIPNANIYNSANAPTLTDATGNPAPTLEPKQITMSENLVLGLLGGLKYDSTDTKWKYDHSLIGKGPQSLNPNNPRGYSAYLDNVNLSDGQFKDDAGSATDSSIPEFVDRFPHPLPILYLRANVGNTGVISSTTTFTGQYQYDLTQILGYTVADSSGNYIGVGRGLKIQGLNNLTTPPTGTIDPREYFASLNDPEWKAATIDPANFVTPKQ